MPQVAIQELVGHGSPAMTAVYSHSNDKQKASAIAALPAIDFGSGKDNGYLGYYSARATVKRDREILCHHHVPGLPPKPTLMVLYFA